MTEDDETTATQLHVLLTSCRIHLSLATILRSRILLGWTFRGSKYCQLVRHANKLKCFHWAVKYLPEVLNDGFQDVIYTDESTVQLESHRRHSYRKKGQPATLKPRPKHPTKVHVWAGISKKGATQIVIFEGIMDATLSYKLAYCHSFSAITQNHTGSCKIMTLNTLQKKQLHFLTRKESTGGRHHLNPLT